MELVVLGSGSAFPADKKNVRNPAGYAVVYGERVALFDLGFGNLRQLARAGLDPARITDVFLTHRHPDHLGDLAALLFLLRYDVKLRWGRLRVWGPRGIKEHVSKLRALHAPWLEPKGYRLSVAELEDVRTVRADGWSLSACAVPHETRALAYRFLYKGKTLVYSGDTGFSPRLADFAADADLFLIECTTSERGRMEGHLTPKLALGTALASGCRRAVLTHLSPGSEKELSRRALPRGVVLARDLFRVIV